MTITFFTNYFNHHQKPLADSFNNIPGVQYILVTTGQMPNFRKKLGYKELTAPYVLDATISMQNKQRALSLAINSDVAIFMGGSMEEYEIPRLKLKKLTFEYSERRFKRGLINILSPNLLRHQWMYYRYGRKAPLYMLCSSAYTANDYYFLKSFVGRCYKWAYFTKVPDLDIDKILFDKRTSKARIMWCGRFIDWKHPELVIGLALKLKLAGYDFVIDMYGNGPLLDNCKTRVQDKNMESLICLKGNATNDEILAEMQKHHIFLFTSDRNEGWGAVANESMSNGCTLVGSNAIGAIPYLVRDSDNGLVFISNDLQSLYAQVERLITNRELCENMAKHAYNDMQNIWSPSVAASRFIQLTNALMRKKSTPFMDGPCSLAIPTKIQNK